jgi:hypothetical protein
MSGHVFHPGHSELHGVTIVVETTGSRTYVGRYDTEDEQGVHILDVGVHEGSAEQPRDEYLKRTAKFGIKPQHRHMIVPRREVARIIRLVELT